MVENRKAGMENNALPIQMAMMIPATTYFDVRIFKGQTMALYLETKQSYLSTHKIRPLVSPCIAFWLTYPMTWR